MRIEQLCASCFSVYDIPSNVYKDMTRHDRVQCPSCGHSNVKQEPLKKHGSQSVHHAKIFTCGGVKETEPAKYGITPQFSRAKSPAMAKKMATKRPTVEALRKLVSERGRVFILGTAPSLLQYDLDSLVVAGWPTFGLNDAFKFLPLLDALVVADYGFICNSLEKIRDWQHKNPGRYIFWMHTTTRQGRELIWRDDALHGRCFDKETGEMVCGMPTMLDESNVVYYERTATDIVRDLEIPIRLNFHDSVVFSAINLAVVLGAKEICLLGVEAEKNTHADANTSGNFPKGKKIINTLSEWASELKETGVDLYTCKEAGALAQKIEYRQFEKVCNNDTPVFVKHLQGKIQRKKKCFVLGAGATLNKMPLHVLNGWPVIGTNTSFFIYPILDALMFGDVGFIEKYAGNIYAWQCDRDEKPVIFWAKKHLSDENAGKFWRVCQWDHAPAGPIYENIDAGDPKFALKRSIVTSAINCAYWLGAQEIYLCGVELDNDAHFWDPDEKVAAEFGKPVGKFPGGMQIAEFIEKQGQWLSEKGVKLYTCSHGYLDGLVEYVDIEEAADPRKLNPNPAFGGQRVK